MTEILMPVCLKRSHSQINYVEKKHKNLSRFLLDQLGITYNIQTFILMKTLFSSRCHFDSVFFSSFVVFHMFPFDQLCCRLSFFVKSGPVQVTPDRYTHTHIHRILICLPKDYPTFNKFSMLPIFE